MAESSQRPISPLDQVSSSAPYFINVRFELVCLLQGEKRTFHRPSASRNERANPETTSQPLANFVSYSASEIERILARIHTSPDFGFSSPPRAHQRALAEPRSAEIHPSFPALHVKLMPCKNLRRVATRRSRSEIIGPSNEESRSGNVRRSPITQYFLPGRRKPCKTSRPNHKKNRQSPRRGGGAADLLGTAVVFSPSRQPIGRDGAQT